MKILLVPPKRKIDYGALSKYLSFQYCDSNIGLSSNAPHKVITLPDFVIVKVLSLNLFSSFFISASLNGSWLLFCIAFLPTIATAIVVSLFDALRGDSEKQQNMFTLASKANDYFTGSNREKFNVAIAL